MSEDRLALGGPLHRQRVRSSADYFFTAEIEASIRAGWNPALSHLPVKKFEYRARRVCVADALYWVYSPAGWDYLDIDLALARYLSDAMLGNLQEEVVYA